MFSIQYQEIIKNDSTLYLVPDRKLESIRSMDRIANA